MRVAALAGQVQEAQSKRLDESQAVRAAALLPLDLSALHAGLEDGSLAELDAITERVLVLSRAAADRLAEQQGTGTVTRCTLQACAGECSVTPAPPVPSMGG